MSTENIQVHVENIKCGGCEKSITIKVEIKYHKTPKQFAEEVVSVTADASLREAVVEKLRKMGYPEQGSVSGLEAGLVNAKSFVSCAIGRMS